MAIATDVLDQARIRQELRLAADADVRILNSHTKAAIDVVSKIIGRNIIDATVAFERQLPYGNTQLPIALHIPDLKENGITELQWRAQDYRLGSGTISIGEADDEAGLSVTASKKWVYIYPPANGWPAEPANACWISGNASVGIPLDNIEESWKQATVLIVRELYDGSALDAIPSNNSVMMLLDAYIDRGDSVR